MAGRETEEELLGRCRGGDDDDRHQIALMLNEVYRKEFWDRFEPQLDASPALLSGDIVPRSKR